MLQDFSVRSIKNVIFVGENKYSEQKTVFQRDLVCSELIFHFSGSSLVCFNGHRFEVTPNTLRFLPAGKVTEYTVERKTRGTCIDIFFHSDTLLSDQPFILPTGENSRFAMLFKRLFSLWVAKEGGYYHECMALLYQIFGEMERENHISKEQFLRIEPVTDYIAEHFLTEHICVEELCAQANISYSYLKKLFLKKYGLPPKKYIIQLKLNHACDLLRSERYSVTEVAELCGFRDVYFFSRQFKEYLGLSPSQFIKSSK